MIDRTAILLISCPDQKGLTAKVSDFIFRHGGNIVHAEQHIDIPQNTFFHRVEWDLQGFALAPECIAPEFKKIADPLQMNWQLRFSDSRQRVAIFVSKFDHCLLDLLYRHRIGELPAEIVAVVSNHVDLQPTVLSQGIPFFFFPINKENKAQQETKELDLMRELKVDLIVLARYMQVLRSTLVQAYPRRIINIHHSFLPAFVGGKPYEQAYSRGVKIIGATSHYVTEELDEGPIIEQDVVRVSHRESVQDMISKGRDLERTVLSRAVKLHLQSRVLPYGNKTVVFD